MSKKVKMSEETITKKLRKAEQIEIDEINSAMETELDEMDEVECLSDYVSKEFEAEGYKQNNLWEYDWDGDVMFGTFIDSNLDAVIVFFPEDLEFIEKEKDDKKK